MKIEYTKSGARYYDINDNEIHEGDFVIIDNKAEQVYLTEDGYLGTDATNPKWIERGWAVPCEFGIYQFSPLDEPVLVRSETCQRGRKSEHAKKH